MLDTALEESAQFKDPFFALEIAVCQQDTDGIVPFILIKMNCCNYLIFFLLQDIVLFWSKEILFTYCR